MNAVAYQVKSKKEPQMSKFPHKIKQRAKKVHHVHKYTNFRPKSSEEQKKRKIKVIDVHIVTPSLRTTGL